MKKLCRATRVKNARLREPCIKKVIPLIALIVCLYASNTLLAQSGLFDRIGMISGHGTHGSMPNEHIDLFTGNLTLKFLDVYLPGPNGLDLKVWRFYNSKILKDRQSGQSASVQAYHQSWVGMGWTMHMGIVHAYASNNPVIEFPDGRLETAFVDINDSGKYITREFYRYVKGSAPLYIPKLYFPDGIIWTFGAARTITRADGTSDPVRLVTRIENAYGHQINIAYDSSKPIIAAITDSMGRVVTFVSSGSPKKLTQIRIQINSTTYRIINYSVGAFLNGYTRLNSVTLPLLPATTFEYENGSSNQYELKKMYTPYGGYIRYAYSNHVFYFNGIWLDSRVLIQKCIMFNPGEPEEIWNYTYPDYNGVPIGNVHVDGPEYDTDIIYNGYDSASPWKVGTISTYQRGSGSLTESTEWTYQQISNDPSYILNTNMGPARGLLRSSFSRDHVGEASTKVEYLYERPNTSRYGQPTRENYYLNGSSMPIHYSSLYYYHEGHQTFVDRYLLDHLSAKTEYSSSGTKLREFINQYYEEDTKWGALKHVMRMRTDTESLSWDYTYTCYEPSHVTTTTDPPGPAEKITSKFKYGVLADETYPDYSKCERIINSYDSSITQEVTEDGAMRTNFYYDVLGSISRIDLSSPKNDIMYNWRPNGENKVVVEQGGNTFTYFRDGLGRDLGYIETGDNLILYYRKTLDAENRMVSENGGSIDPTHAYSYAYNEADDVVQLSDPTGNPLYASYSGNTRTITDSFGHATIYEFNHLPGLITSITDALNHSTDYIYDDIGRLTTVNINGLRTHTYEYDGLDDVLFESHPETGNIIYSYDDSNRLSEKAWGGAIIHYGYDKYNRLRSVQAGNGTSVDETIQYSYERRFREYDRVTSSKGWSREQATDDYGNVTSETVTIPGLAPKTISYSYDSNNNLSRITYPDGNWTEVTSNELNRPERLTFNGVSNILVDSAYYGPNKKIAGLTIIGNGTQYSATYLANGALDEATLTKATTTLYNASYTYDNHGSITAISSNAPTQAMEASFGYDPLNRLIWASYDSGSPRTYAYEYDEYGNMTTARENGQAIFSKDYDTANRIIGNNYDARGNLLFEGGSLYYWDKLNRLDHITSASGDPVVFYMYNDKDLRLNALPPLPDINIKVDSSDVLDGAELILECPVGAPPVDKTFTIENLGLANLILNGDPVVSITGLNADQFIVTQEPMSPIFPSGSTIFMVRFEPTSYGSKTATLSISNNDPDESSYDIILIGNPYPEINIPQAPDGGSWDFGTVVKPDFREQEFTIQNVGIGNLILSGNPPVVITGDPYGQFVVVQQPDTLILPGEETTFVVDYIALRLGQSYAQLSISNNDTDEEPYNITLMGYGEDQQGKTDSAGLDITSPDGGEEVLAGSVRTITWKGGKTTEYVKIEISTDNGSSYKTIIERTPNTGVFDWQVPAELSPVCLIRISDPDGAPAAPKILTFAFNLRIDASSDQFNPNAQLGIHASLPDLNAQISYVANLGIMPGSQGLTEKMIFNGAESELNNIGMYAATWHNVQVKFNLNDLSGSVLLDGLTVLERIPLLSVPMDAANPEIAILRDPTTLANYWIDDFEVNFQDKTISLDDEGPSIKPIVRDLFSPYTSSKFLGQGGWIASVNEKSQSSVAEAQSTQAADQTNPITIQDQGIAFATIDDGAYISPHKALKLKPTEQSSVLIAKKIALPKTIPYDVSLTSFAITSGVNEQDSVSDLEGKEGLVSEIPAGVSKTESAPLMVTEPKSGGDPKGATLVNLSAPWTGSYYIYSLDGRLLAEYDILGNCLKDYLYFGDRIIAEYQPSSGQFLYYTPDHIGSTRIVTDGTGNVEYSAAFNAYGGIQQTWVDNYEPSLKYAGKERDEYTGMDYYGARYYKRSSYRWISPDPVRSISDYDPQSSNLYLFSRDNPISCLDVLGLWIYKGTPSDKQRRAFCAWVAWLKSFDPKLGNQFTFEGDPSDGITVEFAEIDGRDAMKEYSEPTLDEHGIVKATFRLVVDPSLGTNEDSIAARVSLGHEAQHFSDYKAFVDALRGYPSLDYFQKDLTYYASERNAYRVSVRIAGFLGQETFIVDGKYDLMNHNPEEHPFSFRQYDKWLADTTKDKRTLSKTYSGYNYWDH